MNDTNTITCSLHQGAEAVDICSVCRRPVCSQCAVSMAGKTYCKTCLPQKEHPPVQFNTEKKNAFLAFVFSLIPGAGYYYLGLMQRGLQTMILAFGTIFVAAFMNMGSLAALALPIIAFYTIFDTQQLLKKINQGYLVDDQILFQWNAWKHKHALIGALFIIIGVFVLVDNFSYLLPYDFVYRMRNMLPPLLMIGLGIYILRKNSAHKDKTTEQPESKEPLEEMNMEREDGVKGE